jgi:hypothetical protein
LNDASLVAGRVDEEYRALGDGLDLGECSFHRQVRDLRRNRKVELGTLRNLTLNPHVTLNEREEPFRDRQAEIGTTVLLNPTNEHKLDLSTRH